MNNWFNFHIPYFYETYGSDWVSFRSIIDYEVDYLFNKIHTLYSLNDINKMSDTVITKWLVLMGIKYSVGESTTVKRIRLRTFISRYINKGLADVYLDVAEGITGIRGAIYSGISAGAWFWSTNKWGAQKWGTSVGMYNVYFDVKTTDSTELDEIVILLQDPTLLPAFYKMYLIDSAWNILRTV